MSQAYCQLKLAESAKDLSVINTHRGVFRYNRLCFGISSAPAIFKRSMEQLEGKYTEWPNPQIRGENRQSGLTD